ncbi:hypothetical protein PO181_09990 [Leuconostoc suionicum]|uniref:SspB-related isopeptide-forming adhesin n=1 Tax=Leuconostoc suionicum TaxID=1511761 RepID=UPI00233F6D15|nr:SspB-related isopeptide-forming adhesin [Leuconostoc suionicum]MDC2817306.1 hypothetical protein [Leuconostoc suionicum]
MSHNIKHKLRNHIFEGAALATILIPMASPIVAHAADNIDNQATSSNAAKGTDVSVDHSELTQTVKDAEAAGVTVTQNDTKTKVISASDLEKETANLKASYKSQNSKIQSILAQQKSANEKYDKEDAQYKTDLAQWEKNEAKYKTDKATYDAAIAKHANETPLASKDGINVYGDYNEAGKGSLAYYKNFETVIDSSKVNDYAQVSNLGWQSDSKVEAVGNTTVLNSNDQNFNVPSSDMYLVKNFSKGQQIKITDVGTDSVTGKKLNAVITFTDDVTKSGSDDYYLAVGKQNMDGQSNDSIRFEFLNTTGVRTKICYQYADTGKAANLVTSFAVGDTDFYQGFQTNYSNIAALNPNKSGLTEDKTADDGLKGYYNPSGAGLDGFNDTPQGTTGLIGTGSEFTWNFYDVYSRDGHAKLSTGNDITKAGSLVNAWANGGIQYNLFGSSAAMNTVTPPVEPTKPTAPKKTTLTADYTLTDFIVTPNVTKDVELGSIKGDTGSSADGQKVTKGQKLTYPLSASDLPANRTKDTSSIVYEDTLPKEVDYQSAAAFTKDGKTDLSKYLTFNYDEKTRKFTAKVSDEYLKEINSAKNIATSLPVINLYVTANQDSSSIKNQYNYILDDSSFKSNEVVNTTPSVSPDKEDLDADGKDINGQEVKPGSTMHYALIWDLSDMKDLSVDDDTLQKGSSFSDDYDETKVDVTDTTKSDFKVTTVSSKEDVTDKVDVNWDTEKGQVTVKAKDAKAFLVKHGGDKLSISFNPVVKNDATGELLNTATQNNFGQDYQTKTVKNNITANPKPTQLTNNTPNTSFGEKPQGWLYGTLAGAVISLIGIVIYRRPLAKLLRHHKN